MEFLALFLEVWVALAIFMARENLIIQHEARL